MDQRRRSKFNAGLIRSESQQSITALVPNNANAPSTPSNGSNNSTPTPSTERLIGSRRPRNLWVSGFAAFSTIGVFVFFLVVLILELVANAAMLKNKPIDVIDDDFANRRLFCEELRLDDEILEPSNAWSSMIYVLFAIIIGFFPRTDDVHFGNTIWMRMYFVVANMFLGIGSFIWHGTFNLGGYFSDFGGMYMASCIVFAYSVTMILGFKRIERRNMKNFHIIFWIAFVFGFALRVGLQLGSNYNINDALFVTVLVLGVLTEVIRTLHQSRKVGFRKEESRWLLTSVLVMIFAVPVWYLDTFRVICYPNSVFQMHGIWHFATGASFLYFYFHVSRVPFA